MKFSIITATYNSENTIEATIISIISQTYKNIEYIIIDGGSTDNTINIINKYSDFISIVISENDQGIYDALNKGIRNATGDVIGFLHSDDFFAETTIISDINRQFEISEADGVYGNLQYVDKNNINKVIRFWRSTVYRKGLLKRGWMPAHPTLFLKKKVYEDKGLFDLNYRISADYDFILRVFKDSSANFSFLPKVITKMRMGGASNKNFNNILLKMTEDYRAIKTNEIGGFITILLKNLSKIKQLIN